MTHVSFWAFNKQIIHTPPRSSSDDLLHGAVELTSGQLAIGWGDTSGRGGVEWSAAALASAWTSLVLSSGVRRIECLLCHDYVIITSKCSAASAGASARPLQTTTASVLRTMAPAAAGWEAPAPRPRPFDVIPSRPDWRVALPVASCRPSSRPVVRLHHPPTHAHTGLPYTSTRGGHLQETGGQPGPLSGPTHHHHNHDGGGGTPGSGGGGGPGK